MSIGTPNGILDITGATLRVSKMEFRQSTGFDTVLNNVARNTMLLMDETEQTTSNSWALKLPNAWVAEFHGYWASGSSGAPILFNFYNDSTSGTNGYTLSMNDTAISINYDGGSALGSATLSSTLNNDAYRKVAIIFERSVLDVSIDGEHVFHFADSQLRDRVYDDNSGYVTFTHSSTDDRKLKNLKFTNGDKWVREIDSSNIAYVGGNVGIGTTIPGTKLDVSGTIRGTHLMGDGSAISAIQSSNVSDFGSNVTRIGTLETDLSDNSSRITDLSSNLSDNSSRITALESGDTSISGDKTFTGDIIFESNVHMNGGNVFVANTVNLTVSDPIIELGSNNSGTNDLGIIMTRLGVSNSNVAVVFDESDDTLRMGYTLNGANDSVVDLDSNALAVSVQGALSAASVSGDGSGLTSLNASNITTGALSTTSVTIDDYLIHGGDADTKVGFPIADTITMTTGGTERVRIDSSGNVGVGVTSAAYKLDVDGDLNLSTGSTLRINGTPAVFSNWTASGSDIYRSSGNVGIGLSNPSHKLDVSGDINFTGSLLQNGAAFQGSNWTTSSSNIYRASGYVGIGTSNPTRNLHVYNGSDHCFAQIQSSASGKASELLLVSATSSWSIWNNGSDDSLRFYEGIDRVIFDGSNGNVGIGTDNPGEELHVYRAGVNTGIRVESTGAFDSQLHLKTSQADWYIFNNGSDDSLRFYEGSDRVVFDGNGNVGIGTSSQDRRLHVYSDSGHCHVEIESSYSGGDAELILKSTTGHWSIWNNGSDDSLRFYEGSDRVIFDGNGNVGIGTATPYAKLQVYGSGGSIGYYWRMYFSYNDNYGANQYSASPWRLEGVQGSISIYANSHIVTGAYIMSAQGSLGASDERIKKNIVDADDAECLETLRLLKPKKYQYKDVVKRGEEPVWGFIAQEVRDTLPYATELTQEVLPNIYELANVSSSNVITFTNFNTSNLESNATTLIRTKGIDGEDHDIHLAEVIDAHTIRVEEDLTEWIGSVDESGNVVAGNQLFVHGQQVDDFVYLKKESIFTVATAALQEVDRQLQAEKTKTATLETQVAALLARVTALENA